MTEILAHWGVTAAVFMACAGVARSVTVRSWGAAFGAAAVFGVANVLLSWLLGFLLKALLFLPAILTLGLAWLVVPLLVNMALLKLTDVAMKDLDIEGIAPLAGTALAIAAGNGVVNWMF